MADKPVTVFACGSKWGIGSYHLEGMTSPMYGFPPEGMNPHDFSPDEECCTQEELSAWEEARREWDAKRGLPT